MLYALCFEVFLSCCCCLALLAARPCMPAHTQPTQTVCSDVKGVLEALTTIPASRQRLIYRGRVLRDDNTLQDLGAWCWLSAGVVAWFVLQQLTAPDSPFCTL